MSSVRVEVPRPVQLGSLKSENEGQVQFDGRELVVEGWRCRRFGGGGEGSTDLKNGVDLGPENGNSNFQVPEGIGFLVVDVFC